VAAKQPKKKKVGSNRLKAEAVHLKKLHEQYDMGDFLEIIISCRICVGGDVISRVSPLWECEKAASFGRLLFLAFAFFLSDLFGQT